MQSILFCIFLLSFFLVKVDSSQWWQNSKATELTEDTFKQTVGTDKWVMVEFYTRWCGFCRQVSPEIDRLVEFYQDKDDVKITRIEAEDHPDIAAELQMYSFPRFLLFAPNKKDTYYNQFSMEKYERNMAGFVSWITTEREKYEKVKQDGKAREDKEKNQEKDTTSTKSNEGECTEKNNENQFQKINDIINSVNEKLIFNQRSNFDNLDTINQSLEKIHKQSHKLQQNKYNNFNIILLLSGIFVGFGTMLTVLKYLKLHKKIALKQLPLDGKDNNV